ncbi:hypothetical protein [Sphingomonas sp.]|uniref:hypothetical protein n=1 Tax=Sphingomonas sp. TaxID=28214 RepID=UPI002DD62C7F|nr:hypothetical protein [Sphingomonas sp.]
MRTLTILGLAAAATTLGACGQYGDRYDTAPRDRTYSSYDWDRPDPTAGGYYADQYYVDNARYRERRLGTDDRVYTGRDGRYYCRRNDGTTGLIVGGIAGGALGAIIAPGRSGLLGALLGGAAGAAAGEAIDKNNVRCR